MQAYFRQQVHPLAKDVSWGVRRLADARFPEGHPSGRRLRQRLEAYDREMDLAESYAGNAMSGFGNASDPNAAARRAIQELRGALVDYRDTESLRGELDKLEARLRPQALEKGIYG